jgi:enoyl-CoA hydratase
MSANLRVAIDGAVATITLDRADKLNALTMAMLEALEAACTTIDHATTVRAVIVASASDKAFCAGADILEWSPLGGIGMWQRWIRDGHRAFERLARLRQPTIAAIGGIAYGGGLELALACDLRIAADNAVFGLPEPTLGIIPGAGGTQRLPRVVGLGRAKEMILTGARWDAARALEVGLVSAVVPPADLARTAREWADRVLALGPLAVRLAKASLNASSQMPLAAGLAYESAVQAITFESQDKHEGTTAFLEKRKPQFRGE